MTVDAVSARQVCLQSRDGAMAECTVIIVDVDYGDEGIRVMTSHTDGRSRNMEKRFVVNIAVCRRIGRVTDQASGRVSTSSDRGDNFAARAVVTGGTGTGAVGGDVVLSTFNFRPVGNNVTVSARSTGRKITTDFYGMGKRTMTSVAIKTGHLGATHALSDHFADSLCIHPATNIGVAGETARVQRVNISSADQTAGTGGTKG